MAEPFYITTAISYPNGPPHIGHAYEAIAADAIARFQRAQGRDVRFSDRHRRAWPEDGPGGARAKASSRASLPTKCRGYFREMCDTLEHLVRSLHPHLRAATIIAPARRSGRRWRRAGDLYLDRYEGWYSVRDEAFYDESELIDGEGGEKLSPQGTPVEWTVEESWFFRLSKYQQPLLDHYRGQSRLHPAREPPQRGAALRRGRAQGPQRLAHQLRLGRAGAGQRQAT